MKIIRWILAGTLLVTLPVYGGVIRVSQESAAGAGDYDYNILGYITPYSTSYTAAGYYRYDYSYIGNVNGGPLPQGSTALNFFVEASDGLSFVNVYDSWFDEVISYDSLRTDSYAYESGQRVGRDYYKKWVNEDGVVYKKEVEIVKEGPASDIFYEVTRTDPDSTEYSFVLDEFGERVSVRIDADGGRAKSIWTLTGDTAPYQLLDDDGAASRKYFYNSVTGAHESTDDVWDSGILYDAYSLDDIAGTSVFKTTNRWLTSGTDGYVIGSLDNEWSLTGGYTGFELSDGFEESWQISSADGTTIEFATPTDDLVAADNFRNVRYEWLDEMPSSVPEPSSALLMLMGMLGFAGVRAHRSSASLAKS